MYYITDAVRWFIEQGDKVAAIRHDDVAELLGVNTREELAKAGRTLFDRKAQELLDHGVTLVDRSRISVDPRARIGRDTVIYPDVQIEGASVLGEDCIVRSGCRITDTRIGRGVEIRDHCVCQEARIALGAVNATPRRAVSAEAMLRGQTITPELLEAVAAEAQKIATPIDDVRGSASYRSAVVGALTRRTLERAAQMVGSGALPFEEQRRLAVQTAF